MSSAQDRVRAAIESFAAPGLPWKLAELGRVTDLAVDDAAIRVQLELGLPVGGWERSLTAALSAALAAQGWRQPLQLQLTPSITAHAVQRSLKPLAGVRNVVAVASGKGGVGKSTVAVNLALAWAAQGARVGILDADIYGPSQPLMLGLTGQRPTSPDGKGIDPLRAHGLAAMSIGFLVEPEQAVAWRGPMVTQALTQLLGDTLWGELDYLIVDMPPGTGDIQLTLAQRVPVAGAVIVTTPQDIALADARKGVAMFNKVAVPVLGIVENMSLHTCSQCGHTEHIFGAGGGERIAQEFGVPLLGSLPLDIRIREQTDSGRPTVASEPEGPLAAAYLSVARFAAAALACRARDRSALFPRIVVEES
ncbi:MAG: iron-sulfur cluster carrier protein ApbC [Steroidobacteraceae bacterium]